jgi:hypothetical protein
MIISYYAIFVKKCVFMQYGCLKRSGISNLYYNQLKRWEQITATL